MLRMLGTDAASFVLLMDMDTAIEIGCFEHILP